MTDIDVPAHWITSGQLGPVCARHGVAADRAIKRSFYSRTPTPLYLLVFAGVLVFAVVALAIRKTVRGTVPGCERCLHERRLAVASGWGLLALVPVLFVVGAGLESDPVLVLSMFALLAALVSVPVIERRRVHGTVSRDQQTVTLKGVAPEFAAGVRQALGAVVAAQPSIQSVLPGQQW